MNKTHELVNRFIKGPAASKIPNDKVLRLFNTFRLNYDDFLPTTKPSHVTKTPFQFHSTYNGNESYITNPRLSVTKLLTQSWCELRDYYTVYSGSMKEPKGEALILGTQYHEELEADTFEILNIAEFQKVLSELFSGVDISQMVKDIHLDADDTQNFDASDEIISTVLDDESELANEWTESGIARLHNLILNSETRELLVHNYLDFGSNSLKLTDDSVLISGVIDYLQLVNVENPEDLSMFEEIQSVVELGFGQMLDLNQFFLTVDEITSSYKDIYKLKITDVKTRRTNFIPAQESVLKSSYLQVCFYKQFFDTLAKDPKESYHMLCRNGIARNCDLDKPISPIILFGLLRKYPELLLEDFVKISNGEPIGFEPYDTHELRDSDMKDPNPQETYDFTNIFNETHFKHLKEVDGFDYTTILNPSILKKWKKPLTLRYFAARTAQFYNMFHKFESDLVSVEYHNVKTKFNFKTLNYVYNEEDLNKTVVNASNFWNGKSNPKLIDDLRKCKYCDFHSKCSVPNRDLKSFGASLTHFLSSSSSSGSASADS